VTGNVLATLVGDNFCARQRLHADRWPGGVAEVHDGVLLVRLPGAELLQTAFATGFAAHPVETARDWYGHEPFSLWVPDGADLDGASPVEEVIGLAADLAATTILAPAGAPLRVEVVDRDERRDDFISVVLGFDIPADVTRNLFPLPLFTAPSATGYVGYLDDQPVTCCWSLQTGTVTGLYGVFTSAPQRRHGLLRTLLARATADARARGCQHVVAQTSTAEAAFGKLGFDEVVRYEVVTGGPARSTRHPSNS
jgi:GNAT superfamily N-acetyltransferase